MPAVTRSPSPSSIPPSPSPSSSSPLWCGRLLRVPWVWGVVSVVCVAALCLLLWLVPLFLSWLLPALTALQPSPWTALLCFALIAGMCSPLAVGYGLVVFTTGVLFGWWGFPLAYAARSAHSQTQRSRSSQTHPAYPHAWPSPVAVAAPLPSAWWAAAVGFCCSAYAVGGVVGEAVDALSGAWVLVGGVAVRVGGCPPPRPPLCTCAR